MALEDIDVLIHWLVFCLIISAVSSFVDEGFMKVNLRACFIVPTRKLCNSDLFHDLCVMDDLQQFKIPFS